MLPILSHGETPIATPERRSCMRCEVPAAPNDGDGDLHCWFPAPHVANKVRAMLGGMGFPVRESAGGGMAWFIPVGALDGVADALRTRLSKVECEDTRALMTGAGSALVPDDLARVEPLSRLLARRSSQWLLSMLTEQRITSYFQPIMHASAPGVVYGHEALLRGQAAHGELVSPGVMFAAARDAGLLFPLDLAARRSAITSAQRVQLQGALFVNFAPTAIYDPASCLRSTVAAVDQAGIARHDVVFEIVETDRAHDATHLRNILDFYRTAGFRVALDDVGAGYSSLNLIHELHPDLLKLDMELIRGVDADPYKARLVANLLDVAAALQIDTLAEGIETEGELRWVQDHGAKYVQGYLLGRPAAMPVSPAETRCRTAAA